MRHKIIIEFEETHSGQVRAYADHLHRAYVTKKWVTTYGGTIGTLIQYAGIPKDDAKALFRAHYMGWEDDPQWHESRLTNLRAVGLSKEQKGAAGGETGSKELRWEIAVTTPYID